MTRFPLWLSWLILFGLAVLTWQLRLPQGWPRGLAVVAWVIALVWLFVISARRK